MVVRACYGGSTNSYAVSEGSVNHVVDKADQTIVFTISGSKKYGDAPFTISATGGGSGNPVTFELDESSVALLGI